MSPLRRSVHTGAVHRRPPHMASRRNRSEIAVFTGVCWCLVEYRV
jgi:hypothetical protein